MKARLFGDALELYSGGTAPWYFLGLGILLLVVGFFFIKKLDKGFKWYMPTVGLLMTAISATALILGEGVTIRIDKEKQHVHITEKRGIMGTAVSVFAMNNFTHLEVLQHLSLTQEDPTLDSDQTSYVMQLARTNNKPLELGLYEDKEKLRKILDKLRKLLPFSVYLIAPPDKIDDNFYKQFVNEENIEIKYAYPVIVPPDDPTAITPPKHKDAAQPNLEIDNSGKFQEMSWFNRKYVFWITMIDLIIFSLLVLLYRIIILYRNFTRLTITLYVLLVLASIISGAITLATFAGRSHVRFEGSNIVYSTRLFGITAYENRVAKTDILLVSNSLTMDWNTNLTILTGRGLTLLIRLQTETENNVAEAFQNATLEPKAYRMNIDVSPLTIKERLILEKKIQDFQQP